jgi:membrane-bound metal-dependent hydrolase YbcI (DUF457 family)
MMFLTHLSFALLIGLGLSRISVFTANNAFNNYAFLGFLLLGSVFPDIDSGVSFIGRKVKFISFFFRHRGVIHSILALLITSLMVLLIANNWYYSLAFAIGFLSHLLLDSLNISGVALFWPISRRIKGVFKTMGVFDFVFLLLISILNLLILLHLI